jgi:hypothetical protein
MDKLNNEDIQMLMDALDALEEKSTRDGLLSSMLGLMLSKDKEEAAQYADEEMRKAEKVGAAIKDTIILLKAKLITMKDRETVESAKRFMLGGEG